MNKVYRAKKKRRADQIGYFERRKVSKKGFHDSTLGLQPRQDESGIWMSPYVQQELAAYRELTKHEWLQCEVETGELHIQASKLRQQIVRLKGKQRRASGGPDIRYKGEEKLDSWIISERRNMGFSDLEHLEDEYHEIIQKISETENTVRLYCLRVEENTMGRLSIYLQGCAEANPSAQLPHVSSIITHSDAETAYMYRHKRYLFPENDTIQHIEGGLTDA
jgi:hypothetical protein